MRDVDIQPYRVNVALVVFLKPQTLPNLMEQYTLEV